MKNKMFIIYAILIAGCNGNAQNLKESDVPEAVKTSFHQMNPTVTDIDWELENGMYEAEFDDHHTETSFLFKADGSFFQKETEIGISALPQQITGYIQMNMAGKKIKEASIITNADGSITYEAEIDKDDYIFDPNGNLISKESGDEE